MIKLMSFRWILILSIAIFPHLISAQEKPAKDSTDIFDVSLEELLNMKVTTASKSEEKLTDAPGIISVLTKDELNRFGGTNLKSVLERIPGLNVSSAYFTDRSMISARGDQLKVTSGHVLLLLNGRPVREVLESGINSEMFESFPIDIVEKIEVIKGPGSVLYGSDAFSAVINVITKKAEKSGGEISGLIGNSGAYNTSVQGSVKADDLNVTLSARYLNKPNWETSYLFHATSGTDTSLTISSPDKGAGAYLGINYKGITLNTSYANWENWYQYKGNICENKWDKLFSNLGYELKLNWKWSMDFNITYSHSGMDAQNYLPKVKRSSDNILGEWTNYIILSKKSKLIFGTLVNNVSGQENSYLSVTKKTVSDTSLLGYAFYTQIDFKILESLKVIGGVQLNKKKNMDAGIVPRFGVIWYPVHKINVKALYSSAYRAPSINELSLKAPTLHGNPDLKPEFVTTLDIGVSYNGDNLQIGANYFNSEQHDIIRSDFSKGSPGIYANLGKVSFQGVELEGKYYANKNLFINTSILYQENKDEAGNYNVTPIPNMGVKGGLSYVFNKGITVSVFDIYQGDVSSRLTNTLNKKPEPYNKVNVYSNVVLNKLLNWQMKQQISLILQVDNVFNKVYYIPEWGGTVHDAVPGTTGRSIYFGFNAAF